MASEANVMKGISRYGLPRKRGRTSDLTIQDLEALVRGGWEMASQRFNWSLAGEQAKGSPQRLEIVPDRRLNHIARTSNRMLPTLARSAIGTI